MSILRRKEHANRCANTTHGIHINGMDPPYCGSITAVALLLLMLVVAAAQLLVLGWVQSLGLQALEMLQATLSN